MPIYPELISPPLTVIAKVNFGTTQIDSVYSNPYSQYDGYPRAFTVQLTVTPQLTSSYVNSELIQYDARSFTAGMWIGFPGGFTYKIQSITSISPDGITVTLVLEDKDLFNLLVDNTSSGNNFPPEDIEGIVFKLDEEGLPIISNLDSQRGSLQPSAPTYWISDIQGRFRIRNYLTSFFEISPNDTQY